MKRFLSVCAMVAALVTSGLSQEYSRTTTDDVSTLSEDGYSLAANVSGGALSVTNTLGNPYVLESVMFTLPDATFTNVFALSLVRTFTTAYWHDYTVSTNNFGSIETNYVNQVTNYVDTVVTQSLKSVTATNATAVNYSSEDYSLPGFIRVLPGDVLMYSWTETNAFWVLMNATRER